MKNRLLLTLKTLTLLGAAAMLALSAFPNSTEADVELEGGCSGSGHECHVEEPDGTVAHHKKGMNN